MIRVEAIPETGGANIAPRQQAVPDQKKPQRGGEDFKIFFDEACKEIKEKEDKAV